MALEVEVVRSLERFEALESAWDRLLAGSRHDSVFLRHGWFRCVLKAYPRDLLILLVWRGGDLVAIAPFSRQDVVLRGIALRQLGFILAPDTVVADFVFAGDVEKPWASMLDVLGGSLRDEWDLLLLAQWPRSSPYRREIERGAERAELYLHDTVSSEVPFIGISQEWDEFLSGRSAKFRKTLRNVISRLHRGAEVEVRRHSADPGGDVLRAAMEVSSKGRKASDGFALASEPETWRFFQELTRVASREGWLGLWLLTVGGRAVAMEYDLEYRSVAYALRADYDQSAKDLSPGAYLNHAIARDLFGRRYGEYNLGPGLTEYKLRWTHTFRTNSGLRLFNRHVKPFLAYLIEDRLVPRLRAIPLQERATDLVRRMGRSR